MMTRKEATEMKKESPDTMALRIKNLNKDINGMRHILADLKKNPDTEKTFFTREKCEQQLAEAYHTLLVYMYPKLDALYESCITEVCNAKGLELLRKYNWIEACAVSQDGEKLYAF